MITFSLSFDVLNERIAASFKIFSNSAPENPNVCFAISDKLILGDRFLFLACTSKMFLRSFHPKDYNQKNLEANY